MSFFFEQSLKPYPRALVRRARTEKVSIRTDKYDVHTVPCDDRVLVYLAYRQRKTQPFGDYFLVARSSGKAIECIPAQE